MKEKELAKNASGKYIDYSLEYRVHTFMFISPTSL